MTPATIYLIPGLGADGRLFARLQLDGATRMLEWIMPLHPDEPLADYAVRMAARIPEEEACWLIGVSFGGVVAQEMARRRPNSRVILVSSMGPADPHPWLLRLGRLLAADRWLPIGGLRKFPQAGNWFFGVPTGHDAALFQGLLEALPPAVTRWSLGALFRWRGGAARPAVAHLMGDSDRVLLTAGGHYTHMVPGGSHFMVVTQAAEISRLINDIIRQVPA